MNKSSNFRSFVAEDAPQVAALWQRCFRGEAAPPSAAIQKYFVDIFLKHPWYDPEIAPLVLERQGEIVGFIGRMARPMIFRGQTIRCAIASQLMVHPDRKLGFAAIELVRAICDGPQELIYSDGANEDAWRIWNRCGGEAARLLCFEWKRILRPMRSFMLNLREHARLASIAAITTPACDAYDALAVRLLPQLYHKPRRCLAHCQPATAMQILPLLQQVAPASMLYPLYDETSFTWLLDQAAATRSFGKMRTMLVLDTDNTPIGWFIYLVKARHVAHVLQIGATFGHSQSVLSALFRDAWEQGAASVAGQLDPSLTLDLSNSQCQFRCTNMGVLMYSNNPDLLNAIQRGEAFLSRLEGEWWLRLGIDRYASW